MSIDDFWPHLISDGVLTPSEAAQARRRVAENGGSPDLAVLEIKRLSEVERTGLARAVARNFDRALASPSLLDHPEPDALAFLMPRVAERFGVLPVQLTHDGLVVVAGALPSGSLAELAFQLERRVTALVALEPDVRQALRRHLDLPLPPRVAALLDKGVGHLAGLPPVVEEPAAEPTSSASGRRRVVKLALPPEDEEELPSIVPGSSRLGPAPDAAAIAGAIDRLMADAPEPDDGTVLVRAGGPGLDALMRVFPGHLRLDRYAIDHTTVRPSAHSAVVGAVIRFGPRAVPRLEALFDHVSPELRYYAVCCFAGIYGPSSLDRVAGLLFDKDQAVREMAGAVLERYRSEPAFASAAAAVVRALDDEHTSRRRLAAQATGLLHLSAAAGRLVDLLHSPDVALAEAAHRALVEITRQDFADTTWRWRVWLDTHGDAPRGEWLIQGLLNERRQVRQAAFKELLRLTQQSHGYAPDAQPAERKVAVDRWVQWWEAQGRLQYGDHR